MWRPAQSPKHPKAESSKRPPLSPRSTLTEVLRNNQFRVKNNSASESTLKVEDAAISLNKDLSTLANIFPDIKYDCLRELLRRFDGDSRLEVCTEQLYRYKEKWIRGRQQAPPREQDEPIPAEEQFRTKQYRLACVRILYKEFNGLNKSAVDAVLAEVNSSYSSARPILQEIANKSWRATLQSLFRRRKERETIPSFLFEKRATGAEIASTGSEELDQELVNVFLKPAHLEQEIARIELDYRLAQQINEEDAQQTGDLYECQICYADVTFENLTACNSDGHIICLECVRKSLNEAIFGQNWAQSVDSGHGTLRCLAPVDTRCEGCIPSAQLRQAVFMDRSGKEIWAKFEDRLAEKAIFDSQIPLARCPFCSYAEADSPYDLVVAKTLEWHFRPIPPIYLIIGILTCEILIPTLLLLCLAIRIICPNLMTRLFYTAIANRAMQQCTTRFRCLNPACSRKSCLKCQKPWHDTHTCDEPLLVSLRQSVEAARTNAIKRVCPRCGTAFVKSSGCNKLTCVCGYSMCYLCRRNIGKTGENEGAEGYRHFCEHFRPVPGVKCTQCDKCDLYKNEEEDILVKKAGEEAEREWREREGMKNEINKKKVERLKIDHNGVVGRTTTWDKLGRGDWTVQGMVNEIVANVITVKI